MSKTDKNRSFFIMIATMLLAFFAAILFMPANMAKADGYFYADEPAELPLNLANVFAWIPGQGNVAMDTTQDQVASM